MPFRMCSRFLRGSEGPPAVVLTPLLMEYLFYAPGWATPSGSSEQTDALKMHNVLNGKARGLLKERLNGFDSSNCWKVLSHEKVNVQNITSNYSKMEFYDVRENSGYAELTALDIGIGMSETRTLIQILGRSDAKTIGTLEVPAQPPYSSGPSTSLPAIQTSFGRTHSSTRCCTHSEALRMQGSSVIHSYTQAIAGVTQLLRPGGLYGGYNSTAAIYSLYETGDANTPSGATPILNTIYGRQLGGDINNVRKPRCQL